MAKRKIQVRRLFKYFLDCNFYIFAELPAGLKDWNVDREKSSTDAPAV